MIFIDLNSSTKYLSLDLYPFLNLYILFALMSFGLFYLYLSFYTLIKKPFFSKIYLMKLMMTSTTPMPTVPKSLLTMIQSLLTVTANYDSVTANSHCQL